MAKVSVKDLKKIRQETGAGVMEIKQALEAAKGKVKKAKAILRKRGLARASKRKDKATNEGRIFSYVHNGGRIGAMVELRCETDFVSRSREFQELGKELVLQVAGMNPKGVAALLKQEYIRDPSRKVDELIKETAAKVKENIKVVKLQRMEL